jgi:hypothetical protein
MVLLTFELVAIANLFLSIVFAMATGNKTS